MIKLIRFRGGNQRNGQLWGELIHRWWNVIEYYVFLFAGGAVWFGSAFRILKWQRFPFHNHMLEVGLILLCPIVLIAATLRLLDRYTKPKHE
jgi:hypothetical protein